MGCAFTKVCNKSEEDKAIQKIFDFMTSDEELTEPSLIAIAERMKRISLSELKMSKILLDDRIKNVSESNAVDLLLVSITDSDGNITFDKFKKHLKGKRLEEYSYMKDRLKRIHLHRGNINFPPSKGRLDNLHASSLYPQIVESNVSSEYSGK